MTYSYFSLNNPGNIGYSPWTAGQGGSPSRATDTGHLIAAFPDLTTGYAAMSALALNKYKGGATSLNQLIAGRNGWTPGNTIAAANIAASMGIKPTDDLRLGDPAAMGRFQRALTLQETGSTSQWSTYQGAPPVVGVANKPSGPPANYAAVRPPPSGTTLNSPPIASRGNVTPQAAAPAIPPDPWMVTRGYAPAPGAAPGPGSAIAGTTAPATPGGGAGVLPGFPNKAASDQFTQGVKAMDKGLGGSGGQTGGQTPQGPPPMQLMPPQAHHANLGALQQLQQLQQAPGAVAGALSPTAGQGSGALDPWTTAQQLAMLQQMFSGGTSLGSTPDGGYYG